ncbi:DUF1016 N-terminal domain-containing protein [Flammeovirga sp. SJP92]|uniref:DUF1016 N-terminal domain-containing protein n=1 Tax=Flammeovirga sp. SJP92 TaxID=1775430 RepID=UPI0007896677|nr:DUF1016 N-terminal domain-containing protein [Flammeovirga sp. SJP92]KXX71379.1 hypothetical protein AVL50_05610 [Flammeovirga sp. SJP92]
MLVPANFIKDLKQQILQSRYAVAKIANAEMLRLYFTIGELVETAFQNNKWGAKVLEDISSKLQQELPGLRGFSGKNISKMRSFYNVWKDEYAICSSLTSKLEKGENRISSSLTTELRDIDLKAFLSVSFSQHLEIITKIKEEKAG